MQLLREQLVDWLGGGGRVLGSPPQYLLLDRPVVVVLHVMLHRLYSYDFGNAQMVQCGNEIIYFSTHLDKTFTRSRSDFFITKTSNSPTPRKSTGNSNIKNKMRKAYADCHSDLPHSDHIMTIVVTV